MSKEYPGENRGFGFLDFYNNTCANAAKAILSAASFKYTSSLLSLCVLLLSRDVAGSYFKLAQMQSGFVLQGQSACGRGMSGAVSIPTLRGSAEEMLVQAGRAYFNSIICGAKDE